MTGPLMSRRSVLAGVSALGFAGVVQAADGPAEMSADWLPGPPGDRWRHLIRMQSSTRSEDVPWWYTGRIYAQLGDQAPQHLFNLEGTEIYWPRELADGSFATSSRTLTFFRDKDSGDMIREYRNPFTGALNKVAANRLGGPDDSIYSAAGWRFAEPALSDTAEPEAWQVEWRRAGDLAWYTSSRFSRILPQPWLESMTAFCSEAALRDTTIHNLPSHFSSTYLSPWPRWMEMGDRPGHLVWHSSGRKLASAAEIPAEYRRRVNAEYGGVLTAHPDSWD